MLKLKLQHFGHLMLRADSLEKTQLIHWKDRRQEEKGATEDKMSIYPMDMSVSRLQEIVKDREAWRAAAYGVTKSWT